jgi:hypothetical protein
MRFAMHALFSSALAFCVPLSASAQTKAPTKGFDLVAKKGPGHAGPVLTVTNGGANIPAGYVVQVVDYVPVGMTVSGISAAGWSCVVAPALTMTGPGTITCSRPTPFAALASWSIYLTATSGPGACQNCMRTRLTKDTATIAETNTDNNVSCQ